MEIPGRVHAGTCLDAVVEAVGITPYFRDEHALIYCADCRTILPKISAGMIDLCLTDPPYGETSCVWDTRCSGWLAGLSADCRTPGLLVAIMSEGAFFRETVKARTFRALNPWSECLPEGTFKSSGTMIRSRLVRLEK